VYKRQWLGDVSFIYRWHESYSNSIWQIGEQEHCVVLDIRSEFLTRRAYQSLLCSDGIHPNRAGHEVIKHAIVEFAKRRG
ncbi:MAG: SGNH/GDSL hydrolase family protein, partial [Rectinema sp.]|nr:SGNH/GDSL hydrolase family protein [Rectinema sp.]